MGKNDRARRWKKYPKQVKTINTGCNCASEDLSSTNNVASSTESGEEMKRGETCSLKDIKEAFPNAKNNIRSHSESDEKNSGFPSSECSEVPNYSEIEGNNKTMNNSKMLIKESPSRSQPNINTGKSCEPIKEFPLDDNIYYSKVELVGDLKKAISRCNSTIFPYSFNEPTYEETTITTKSHPTISTGKSYNESGFEPLKELHLDDAICSNVAKSVEDLDRSSSMCSSTIFPYSTSEDNISSSISQPNINTGKSYEDIGFEPIKKCHLDGDIFYKNAELLEGFNKAINKCTSTVFPYSIDYSRNAEIDGFGLNNIYGMTKGTYENFPAVPMTTEYASTIGSHYANPYLNIDNYIPRFGTSIDENYPYYELIYLDRFIQHFRNCLTDSIKISRSNFPNGESFYHITTRSNCTFYFRITAQLEREMLLFSRNPNYLKREGSFYSILNPAATEFYPNYVR